MSRKPAPSNTLFPVPGPSFHQGMASLQEIIARAMPLKAKHRGALPSGVRRLSEYLTVERDHLPRDYMARPEFLSAYLNYFLPWNVYRQGRLLQGLQLDLPDGAHVLDLGAGPMTFLHALWLACPQLHERKIEYTAVDRSEPALKMGRNIFARLAGEKAGWKASTSRLLSQKGRVPADLLVAANFINELAGDGGKRHDPEAPASEDLILEKWENQVHPEGAVLLIEPAMRPTARRVTRMRRTALRRGWQVVAPCPHAADCPMTGMGSKPWCHFNFSADGAPDWLLRFSRKVKLPKENSSLSFLLLTRGEKCRVGFAPLPTVRRQDVAVRVISEVFSLPEGKKGCYGCSEKGMVLLAGAVNDLFPQPGELLLAPWPERPVRDAKSRAIILPRSP
jgi:hypothetical protein